jgi:prepilin-type processing-associated H-X9-DG protein
MHGDKRRAGVFNLFDAVGLNDITDGSSNVIAVGEVTNRSFANQNGVWIAGKQGGRTRPTDPVYRSLMIAGQTWVPDHGWLTNPSGPGPLLSADGGTARYGSAPWWSNPYHMTPVYYARNAMNNDWPGAGSYHPNGAQFVLADGHVKFINQNISVSGRDIAGNVRVGDDYGRWGNVWTAAHLIQGITDPETSGGGSKTSVNWGEL